MVRPGGFAKKKLTVRSALFTQKYIRKIHQNVHIP